ncbi:MAG: tRNA (N6-isopentenyl adenosine(37)-C2)-methylthiotransferase MiaB, partial [Armatimonadota bacterium]|nr:tRNA (N6-isopentenyl adenosine(37)-C2)-methylthiotransferase MiaB [Armatimonadota bacterium]
MNEDDSLQMANLLERMGYRQVMLAEEADIILLNTCSVRDKPERKVMSKLGELKALKKIKDNLIIGVCGCMAQRAGEEIVRRAPYVDMVIGTSQIFELPQLISRIHAGEKPIFALDLPKRNGCIAPAKPNRI